MDNRWAQDMFTMFELVRMLPECTDDFAIAAANLFFKVAKNHRRYDGNKRSAICCFIFFGILNNQKSNITSREIEDLALEVAASCGNTGDQLVPRLRAIFEQKASPIS
jgi:prophage maintenance system killer protein